MTTEAVAVALADTSDQLWARWQAKGRASDARLGRQSRVFVIVASVAAIAALTWMALSR